MKKYLLILASAATFYAGCNNTPEVKPETSQSSSGIDTSSVANTQKDNGQAVMMNGVSDTLVGKDGSQYVKVKEDSLAKAAPVAAATSTNLKHTKKTKTHRSSTGNGASSSTTQSDNTVSTTQSADAGTTTTTTKKKGWSKAAKGTAIGAGTGALAGALISKKKGTGAIIGGLIGAGGGYVIGHSKDKKDKQKEQQATNPQ